MYDNDVYDNDVIHAEHNQLPPQAIFRARHAGADARSRPTALTVAAQTLPAARILRHRSRPVRDDEPVAGAAGGRGQMYETLKEICGDESNGLSFGVPLHATSSG